MILLRRDVAPHAALRPACVLAVGTALGAAILIPTAGMAAAERRWEVSHAEVRVVCPLTVGGSFEAKTESLEGTMALGPSPSRPPSFSGALAVDLRTLATGIALRDSHMREKYLEVDKGEAFARAVLSDVRLGDVDPDAFEGRTHFTGSFLLHGTTRPIEGEVEVRRSGSVVHLDATFPVNIPDFGIPKPRYLGVGVKDRVQVHVSFDAAPSAAGGAIQ